MRTAVLAAAPRAASHTAITAAILLAISFWLPLSSAAQPPPVVILILCEGMSLDDLQNPALPNLRSLAASGAVGMMNTAVAGPKDDLSAMLTLALGYRAAPETTDRLVYDSRSQAVEHAQAGIVFRRRTGIDVTRDPKLPLVHLGIAPLTRRGLNYDLFGAVLASGNRTHRPLPMLVCTGGETESGSGCAAGLMAVDARGVGGPAAGGDVGRLDAAGLARWIASCDSDLVIVHVPGVGGAERESALRSLDALIAQVVGRLPGARILLVSPAPEAAPNGKWDRLAPIVLAGRGIRPGLLTSATTRTDGLVANVDVAPTLLESLGEPSGASMIGHPILAEPTRGSLDRLERLDQTVTVNGHALVPVFVLLGAIGLLVAAAAIAVLAAARVPGRVSAHFDFRTRLAPAAACGVLFLMNMPLAMLLVVPIHASSVLKLAGSALTIMSVLTLAELWLSRRVRRLTPCLTVAIATVGVVLVDTLVGQPLVKFSPLSAYQLEGIRFYGIGNEYMGILVGYSLLAAFLGRLRPAAAALTYIAVTLIGGLPALGAKAGMFVTAAVAFGTGWTIMRRGRAGWWSAVGWTAAGFALAFAVAAWESAGDSGAPSHLGEAMRAAAAQRGPDYLVEIASRKLGMNAGIAVRPGMIAAMAVIAVLAGLARGPFRDDFDTFCSRHPDWARALPAAGFGALAALLFNDSGVVAAAFLVGVFLASGLFFLLQGAHEKPPESCP